MNKRNDTNEKMKKYIPLIVIGSGCLLLLYYIVRRRNSNYQQQQLMLKQPPITSPHNSYLAPNLVMPLDGGGTWDHLQDLRMYTQHPSKHIYENISTHALYSDITKENPINVATHGEDIIDTTTADYNNNNVEKELEQQRQSVGLLNISDPDITAPRPLANYYDPFPTSDAVPDTDPSLPLTYEAIDQSVPPAIYPTSLTHQNNGDVIPFRYKPPGGDVNRLYDKTQSTPYASERFDQQINSGTGFTQRELNLSMYGQYDNYLGISVNDSIDAVPNL